MIKTFPLQFTDAYHEMLAKAAEAAGLSLKAYIMLAIENKLKEDKENG